ncbi:hypothetical protein [Halorubrum tebenquichense]|uniref:Glycine zipper domain-containing protein n=1 Tax=Halorubrum tebenquichense DSM 14210 TaxID=1227485 RepID=M0DPP1_9EURY|nr:hypothetical protein [Halorubrum tebenquichense]ELZ36813.1 hypothetical protein C472_09633 [Halorubrum tebenquichense DSM 14210]
MGVALFLVSGLLGLLIGSLLGPPGALFGLIAGLFVGAFFWDDEPDQSQRLNELEQRVSELEAELERERNE